MKVQTLMTESMKSGKEEYWNLQPKPYSPKTRKVQTRITHSVVYFSDHGVLIECVKYNIVISFSLFPLHQTKTSAEAQSFASKCLSWFWVNSLLYNFQTTGFFSLNFSAGCAREIDRSARIGVWSQFSVHKHAEMINFSGMSEKKVS